MFVWVRMNVKIGNSPCFRDDFIGYAVIAIIALMLIYKLCNRNRESVSITILSVLLAVVIIVAMRINILILYQICYINMSNTTSFTTNTNLDYLCGDGVNINIITRTGDRRGCYNQLAKSLSQQTHRNFRHVLTVDKKDCDYIDHVKERDIVRVTGRPKTFSGSCYYNTYFNDAMRRCDPDSWIIFLDDDLHIYDPEFLSRLAKIASTTPKDTFFTVGKKLYDTSTICIHRDLAIQHKWGGLCGGDISYIHKLLSSGTKRVVYSDIDPGCHVNHFGKSNGTYNNCEFVG